MAKTVLDGTAALRQIVAPLLKDSTGDEEFPAYSGYGSGRGVDLSFALQGTAMKARLAVIPLAQGFVSFALTCAAGDAASARRPTRRGGYHAGAQAMGPRLQAP